MSEKESITKWEPSEAYELVHQEEIKELKGIGSILYHKKSGARVVILENEDENKVFSIGFRTPPDDLTGVPHIIEHTVLCGSEKFPAKDPFVELVKGSLNTFLNAMTYPDKTLYPVASCNEKDFQNLMQVYMDAVFFPNIYKREEIFKQEGWHYELEDKEAPIVYNGVVFNEMKGSYSSPEECLISFISRSLFPDHTYGKDSGGNPDNIPELTYEKFLNFHRKYYHPSNSYIYLYGAMNVKERLDWMDKAYLHQFEKQEVNSEIPLHSPVKQEITEYYSASEEEKESTYLSYSVVLSTSLDKKLYLAFQILNTVLLSAPGAPLKQALLDAGIGKDVMSSYDNTILQPVLSIIVKNSEEERKEQFLNVLRETLKKLIQEGLDEKSLKAAINNLEFRYREADFGTAPKGLIYGLQIMNSWLYDDGKPFIHIQWEDTLTFLKEQIGTGYYEELIQKYFLENEYHSVVILKPKAGLNEKKEKETEEKLRTYKENLSEEEIQKLIEDTKHLKEYQEEPTSKEDIEKIPILKLEDIEKKTQPLYNTIKKEAGVTILHHKVDTNGIGYLDLLFDIKKVPASLIPYLGLLRTALGYVDTEHYSFLEFSNEVNIETGGIVTDILIPKNKDKRDDYTAWFEVKTKAFYHKLPKAIELIEEMLFHTLFQDEKRMKEIISEIKSRMEISLPSRGDETAIYRAMSYLYEGDLMSEKIKGIEYYQFICALEKDYSSRKQEILDALNRLIKLIFCKEGLLISFTAEEEGYQAVVPLILPFAEKLFPEQKIEEKESLKLEKKNEGWITPGQVQYVVRAGDFLKRGYTYTGALDVLDVILIYDYMWTQIRVKGGAYGCSCWFYTDGFAYFSSYRDPNLKETNEVYRKIPEYIRQFSVDERNMTKYIIGTISNLDTPRTPADKGSRSLLAYLRGMEEKDYQKIRDQVLSTKVEDIRNLAPLVEAILEEECICTIGSSSKIQENKEMFKEVKKLL